MIAASILSADFSCLGKEVKSVLAAGVDAIHFDVMDHHFVPNLSFGPCVCQSLRDCGIVADIDVHLMVDSPQDYVQSFADAGASSLTFHPETVKDPEAVIQQIHDAKMKAGLAFNPDKPVNISDALCVSLDLILIMSVYPGFSGQTLIETTLDKIKQLSQRLKRLKAVTHLAVDGGIKVSNIKQIAEAGANYFVLGSGLFSAQCYTKCVESLREILRV